MTSEKYQVKAPAVVSETIDGEVVIMNLKSGNYYSLQHTGADIWEWIERGFDRTELIDALETKYAGERSEMEKSLGEFIEHLTKEYLVEPLDATDANGGGSGTHKIESSDTPKTKFQTPQLNVYSDMQDLLLLDPIHDVDETGWPTPKDS